MSDIGFVVLITALIAALNPEGFGRWLGVIVAAFNAAVAGAP